MKGLRGISGALSPEGKFYKCDYGEHHILINKLLKENIDLSNFVIFSSSGPGQKCESMGYCSCRKITKQQKDWVIDHIDKFDDEQLNLYVIPHFIEEC